MPRKKAVEDLPLTPGSALTLKIELRRTRPLIHRTLLVPAGITLPDLHDTFQCAMGWDDEHLHEFIIAGEHYGESDPDVVDEQGVRLDEALQGTREFEYVYDFGDDWRHRVRVIDVTEPAEPIRSPRCLGGANACPPEDIGGVGRYAIFLEAFADPSHPQHDDMIEWVDEPFDPKAFDVEGMNLMLQDIQLEEPGAS